MLPNVGSKLASLGPSFYFCAEKFHYGHPTGPTTRKHFAERKSFVTHPKSIECCDSDSQVCAAFLLGPVDSVLFHYAAPLFEERAPADTAVAQPSLATRPVKLSNVVRAGKYVRAQKDLIAMLGFAHLWQISMAVVDALNWCSCAGPVIEQGFSHMRQCTDFG